MLKVFFMSFLCENLRGQKIIFEYKLRYLLARVWYLKNACALVYRSGRKLVSLYYRKLDLRGSTASSIGAASIVIAIFSLLPTGLMVWLQKFGKYYYY